MILTPDEIHADLLARAARVAPTADTVCSAHREDDAGIDWLVIWTWLSPNGAPWVWSIKINRISYSAGTIDTWFTQASAAMRRAPR